MRSAKLSRLPEKYIVDFYDAFSNIEDGVVCLMIEYMDGGSLQDIVDTGGCEDEVALANIAVQALKGLSFLHGNMQIHRDLKVGLTVLYMCILVEFQFNNYYM
jgi:serine/threonine protein kinase